jgi:hypothetical protein
MRDGALVEVATVGSEGMLGIGVFLGDRSGAGRMFQQLSAARVVTSVTRDDPCRCLPSFPEIAIPAINPATRR